MLKNLEQSEQIDFWWNQNFGVENMHYSTGQKKKIFVNTNEAESFSTFRSDDFIVAWTTCFMD